MEIILTCGSQKTLETRWLLTFAKLSLKFFRQRRRFLIKDLTPLKLKKKSLRIIFQTSLKAIKSLSMLQ